MLLKLASDGVWDMITNEEVVTLLRKHKNSAVAAKVLAQHSRQERLRLGKRLDDITVTIFDVDLRDVKTKMEKKKPSINKFFSKIARKLSIKKHIPAQATVSRM